MARQNASVDNLREDQIGFRANKLNIAPKATEVINRIPNLNQVQFPQEAFQQPDRESMTANFISNLLPKAGEVVGDVVSRGQEIAGTGLEKLTELAKDPRTYEVLSNVLAVGSAPYSPQLAQTYGNIASGIKESRIAKQEAEKEEAKLASQLLRQEEKDKTKLEEDYRKEIEQNKIIKDTRQVNSAVSRMNKVWETYKNNPNTKSKNALDQALVITFNKMMDPGSVVRESEFARTPQGLSLIARLEGLGEKFKQGGVGLTDEARQEIINISRQLQSGQIDEANRLLSTYEDFATQRNLNTKKIFKYFKNPILETTKSQPANKPQQTVPKQKKQTVTDKEAVSMFGES